MTASPRIRLFSAPDLPSFRRAIADCLDWNRPLDLRGSMVLVASRAAAGQLRWTLEQRLLAQRAAFVLPPLVTRDGLYAELHRRLDAAPPRLNAVERLVCGRAAAEETRASGAEPPFNLRPGLVDEFLGLYDELRRNRRDVDAFERMLVETLEPSRDLDRGARRMLRQTRFLAGMFRAYERRVAASDRIDEHGVRATALARGLRRPVPQVVLTVADRASGPDGLWSGDFDLLARLPGLVRLDVVSTSSLLAAGYRERLADLLPGIEETAAPSAPGARARLVAPDAAPRQRYFTWRDREEELLAVVRQVKSRPAAERTAVVFQRPLPYLYAARHLFASAGVPHEVTGTLPLASEPFASAIDLVLSFVSSGYARRPTVELLRSPHFHFSDADGFLDPSAVSALDEALRDARYVGGHDEDAAGPGNPLRRLAVRWAGPDGRGRRALAVRAARAAAVAADDLEALTRPGPASALIDCLLRFADGRRPPPPDDAEMASRESRARAAVLAVLRDWRDAHVRHDDPVVELAAITSTLRRLLEAATFAAPAGAAGAPFGPGAVVLADARAARYGAFDNLCLVGLVDREWPDLARSSSLYPAALLYRLGWPREVDRQRAARAAFRDLVGSAACRVTVSTVAFEDDAVVAGSPLLEDLAELDVEVGVESPPAGRVTADAGLAEVPAAVPLADEPAEWLALRERRRAEADARVGGQTGPLAPAVYAVSAAERYLNCPFQYFASTVLRLGDEPDDEVILGPRSRGRFVHEVLRVFFERWQDEGDGAVDLESFPRARALAAAVVEEKLAELPPRDRAVERGPPAGLAGRRRRPRPSADARGGSSGPSGGSAAGGPARRRASARRGGRAPPRAAARHRRPRRLDRGRAVAGRRLQDRSRARSCPLTAASRLRTVRRAGARRPSRARVAARRGGLRRVRRAADLGSAEPPAGHRGGVGGQASGAFSRRSTVSRRGGFPCAPPSPTAALSATIPRYAGRTMSVTSERQLPLFGDGPEDSGGRRIRPGRSPGVLRDASARAFAVDPANNVVLEASAGTGKTTVLVSRYVNLLRAGVDPSNILAITFTRQAAAEMRDRIIRQLRLPADGPPVGRDRWRGAARSVGGHRRQHNRRILSLPVARVSPRG